MCTSIEYGSREVLLLLVSRLSWGCACFVTYFACNDFGVPILAGIGRFLC
ncbi:hypothetical protein M758_7G164100 [Ceratodon purpureus]|nr:hypothetical protein M758_7G164100 [Ceratodon purpureus]